MRSLQLAISVLVWSATQGFVAKPHFATVATKMASSPLPDGPQDADDFASLRSDESEYTGDIDWDNEWKKVVKNGGQESSRPSGDYKSEAEIAAIRAANKATTVATKAAVTAAASAPSFDQLKGDWKFWIGLLAIVSVGFSLLSASGMQGGSPAIGSPDSYYI